MNADKYNNFILTIIAAGIILINFHPYKGEIIKDAYAVTAIQKVQICDPSTDSCAKVSYGYLQVDE